MQRVLSQFSHQALQLACRRADQPCAVERRARRRSPLVGASSLREFGNCTLTGPLGTVPAAPGAAAPAGQ